MSNGLYRRRSSQHTEPPSENGINSSLGYGNGNDNDNDNDDKKTNAVEAMNLVKKCEDNVYTPFFDQSTTSCTTTSFVSSAIGNHSSTAFTSWCSSLSTAFAGLSFLINTASVNKQFDEARSERRQMFDEARSERRQMFEIARLERKMMMMMITSDRTTEDDKKVYNGKISELEAEISKLEAEISNREAGKIAISEQAIQRGDAPTAAYEAPSNSIV